MGLMGRITLENKWKMEVKLRTKQNMCNSLPLASSVLNVQWLILKPFKGFFSFLKVPNIPKMDWFDFLNWVRLMQCRKWCWRPPKWCPFCWLLLWISWMFPIFFMDWRNLLFLFIMVTSQVFNVQECVIYHYCFYIYIFIYLWVNNLFVFLPKIVSKDLDGNVKELINENGIL
jgi:hypothetical protein